MTEEKLKLQEGFEVLEFDRDNARRIYSRLLELNQARDGKSVIAGPRHEDKKSALYSYHILNSTVDFFFQRDYSNLEEVFISRITIASGNPQYRQESLSKLEEIMGICLRTKAVA
jgi:hypothetical protein